MYFITDHQGFPWIKSEQFCSPHPLILKSVLRPQTSIHYASFINDPGLLGILKKKLPILIELNKVELRLIVLHFSPSS